MAWQALESNTPDRADHYQMQTACEVRRVLRSNPESVKLEHFKLEFGSGVAAPVSKADDVNRKVEAMRRSLVKRGGFSKEQMAEILANARKRLEGNDDG